jgi:circadian clock protein KaiC
MVTKKRVTKKVSKAVKKKVTRKSTKTIKKKVTKKTVKKTSLKKTKRLKKVPTGIKELDKLTHGGFQENSINIVTGATGSGKSIFATQFIEEGIKKGESCLYITFEEKKEGFYTNMAGLGIDMDKLERTKKLFFLEYTPEKVKIMLEEGGGIIESIVMKENIDRIVIDSITSFLILFESDMSKRKAILSLFNMLEKWSCTSLLTYEARVSKDQIRENILEFESDSIIILHFTKGLIRRKRQLEILKMRGTEHPIKRFDFKIKKKGIKIKV